MLQTGNIMHNRFWQRSVMKPMLQHLAYTNHDKPIQQKLQRIRSLKICIAATYYEDMVFTS